MKTRGVIFANYKLKGLRTEHRITQSDMAARLNIPKKDYAKKENGEKVFDIEDCLKISGIFNKQLRDIFDGYFDGFLT